MARSTNLDPLDRFRWIVFIDDFTKAGFSYCSVPEYEITAKDYPEGGNHLNPLKIIESVNYKPVVLSRGVTNDTSFSIWATGFIDLVQSNSAISSASTTETLTNIATSFIPGSGGDKGASLVPSNNGNLTTFDYRRTVKIQHVNRQGIIQIIYTLYNAFPILYKPASDFDAKAEDTVSMETITLSYEGFDIKYAGIAGAAVTAVASSFL